jgi:hypothetical protein
VVSGKSNADSTFEHKQLCDSKETIVQCPVLELTIENS